MTRKLIAASVALALLAGCGRKNEPLTPAPEPTPGRVITDRDPRDIDQCLAQPELPWCKAACRIKAREWCNV